MPKLDTKGRAFAVRVPSEEIAPGTWVEFRARLKLKHLRAVAEMATWQDVDWGKNMTEALDAIGRIGHVLSQVVVAWNWQDEDGEPLPQPKNNPDVFGELELEQLVWLIEHMAAHVGKLQAKKKTSN